MGVMACEVVQESFVIAAYSRRVVGWQLAAQLRTTLVLDELHFALGTRASATPAAAPGMRPMDEGSALMSTTTESFTSPNPVATTG
jgi:transposase InsO family protein